MSHWCDFCQVEHSANSCYHPGRKQLTEARELLRQVAGEKWHHDKACQFVVDGDACDCLPGQARIFLAAGEKT